VRVGLPHDSTMTLSPNQSSLSLDLTAAGGPRAVLFRCARLSRDQVDISLLLLALDTVLSGPPLSIRSPQESKAHISVADTTSFLIAAVVVALGSRILLAYRGSRWS